MPVNRLILLKSEKAAALEEKEWAAELGSASEWNSE